MDVLIAWAGPRAIISKCEFKRTCEIREQDFTIVAYSSPLFMHMWSEKYTGGRSIEEYQMGKIVEILANPEHRLLRLFHLLGEEYDAINVCGKVQQTEEITDRAIFIKRAAYNIYTIMAPFYIAEYAFSATRALSAEDWQAILGWPEDININCAQVMISTGDRAAGYNKHIYVNIKSPMVKLYYQLDQGIITQPSHFVGRRLQIKFNKKRQHVAAQLIGVTTDGGKIYAVAPAIYVAPRTLPYNYIVYKNRRVAHAPVKYEFHRKKTLVDIIEDFKRLELTSYNYTTPAKKLHHDECCVCLDNPAEWICARCCRGYACMRCGENNFDSCPLCRAAF